MRRAQNGFTLIEVMITTAVLAVMFGLMYINLGKPQTVASLNGAVEMLVADLRSQQTLAMTGGQGGGTQQPHGIFVSSGSYTLFSGDSFDGGDPNNFTVTPDSDTGLSTTLPDAQVLFEEASGEVSGFSDGNNTITVTGIEDTKIITINRFGIVTVE